jgi:DNA-binding CsgD family transcriptional regulator
MMKRELLADSKRLDIIQLCHSTLDSQTLRVELLKRIRTLIPFDYAYFSTTDPATQLSTSSVLVENPPSWCMSVFIENEFLQEDFNKFNNMLRNYQAVAVLSEATGHDLSRSQRYQNMLAPMGMDDELRAIFVTDTACWGTLCLHREQAYNASEAALLAQLTPHIADGLRKALLLGNAPLLSTPDGPGVLILLDDLSIVGMTATAEYWLKELSNVEGKARSGLPPTIRSVVAGLQAIERGLVTNFTPKVRLRTPSGHWLVLYASRLRTSESPGQITVIFERAQPSEIAPLIMQVYDLTKREGEVTQCVLLGSSTAEIAARLHISTNTVQDHLKAIFEKVDVSSRGELAGRIFTQQYQPHLSAGIPADISGQFGVPNHSPTQPD